MVQSAIVFEEHRRLLKSIAYRMLGSLADAADVVQETYLKWQEAEGVENPKAWLVTVCTRTALNVLASARKKRESYYGIWLPEPYVESSEPDAFTQMETDESISIALLKVLEMLTPAERAVYLLHEVFEYPFEEIAAILQKENANCRKIFSRARKQIESGKMRFEADATQHERLLKEFVQAVSSGNAEQFSAILAKDAILYADGGGKAQAALHPMIGGDVIAQFMVQVWQDYAHVQKTYALQWFNGVPGLLIYENGQLATAISLHVENGAIRHMYALRNPDKLAVFNTIR